MLRTRSAAGPSPVRDASSGPALGTGGPVPLAAATHRPRRWHRPLIGVIERAALGGPLDDDLTFRVDGRGSITRLLCGGFVVGTELPARPFRSSPAVATRKCGSGRPLDCGRRAGLAERRRRPGDRRAWEVSITPNGRRTLERARRLVAQVQDEVLRGLSAADRGQLLTLLRRALVSAPPQPPWRPQEGD